jgi:hypothetical protein
MEFAVSTVYEARRSLLNRHSRQRVGGREMILQLSNKPSPSEDALSIQAIVKARGVPGSQSVALLNFKRADFKNASTLSKALQGSHKSVKKLSGFGSSTIKFVRVSEYLVLKAYRSCLTVLPQQWESLDSKIMDHRRARRLRFSYCY